MKNKDYIISGIQQMGVGVYDLSEAWDWYIRVFGMDCRIFEDDTVAKLMLPYTGGEPRSRHAVLAMNLQSGGGFEVWQYKGREPVYRDCETKLGDLGIFACKMKVKDVDSAWRYWKDNNVEVIGQPAADPSGSKSFFVKDPFGNLFHIVGASDWFMNLKKISGGSYGAIIGVSDIDRALPLYSDILDMTGWCSIAQALLKTWLRCQVAMDASDASFWRPQNHSMADSIPSTARVSLSWYRRLTANRRRYLKGGSGATPDSFTSAMTSAEWITCASIAARQASRLRLTARRVMRAAALTWARQQASSPISKILTEPL